ncbi:MAG: Gfo/Idh/MocA family oxidoreductase [Rhodobacteraceae bacterium]|nr:Gfo/Idh/MocA family oxidoreductase [Paracoccaceae bacterium]
MTEIRQPIRYGMVGGGLGGFIGGVHRIAAAMDGEFRLVAGALSSNPEVAHASACQLGLPADRSYADYRRMAAVESEREDGMQAVVIVTPNHLHAEQAKAFLAAGIHVICDKPLTATLDQALELYRVAKRSDRIFAVTYCYTGYPMVREARQRIRDGEIGALRLIDVEYPQGWLATALEETGDKKASWRTDPLQSGPGGCVADIGTHAYHMARFVSGDAVESVSAQLTRFSPGRRVDDDVQARLRFAGGAQGMLWASQVAVGHENGLKFRIYGESGSLEWVQADPTYLWKSTLDGPRQLLTRAGAGVGNGSLRHCRTAAGHPEGYLEAFATIYTEAAEWIRAGEATAENLCPGIEDGLEGMRFIDACIASSNQDGAWTDLG